MDRHLLPLSLLVAASLCVNVVVVGGTGDRAPWPVALAASTVVAAHLPRHRAQ
jgi:hypothetical protein